MAAQNEGNEVQNQVEGQGQDNQIRRAMAGLQQSVPFVDALWSQVSTARMRLVMLRAKRHIAQQGVEHQRLTAFYIGAIEGVIRKDIPLKLEPAQIGELTFALAMYTSFRDHVIATDDQWVAMATEFQQVLGQPGNARFAQLGVSYVLKAKDSESIWSMLEQDVASAS